MDVTYTADHREASRPKDENWVVGQGPAAETETHVRHRADDRRSCFKVSSTAGADRRPSILIVDDNESVRETLADLLDVVGFCAVEAADAAEALNILRQQSDIDVLITDLSMPGADGIALIQQARAIRHDLPAILLTGYAEQATAVTCGVGDQYQVLRKPVQGDWLIELLELLLAPAGDT